MDEDRWLNIAKTIRAELARHNLTRIELAQHISERLGRKFGTAALRRRMYGQTEWRVNELEAVARSLNSTVDILQQPPSATPWGSRHDEGDEVTGGTTRGVAPPDTDPQA